MTDIITFILSISFLILGASRGFVRSLLVPFSIIAATIISLIYYEITKDMIVSLIIGLIGPWLLHMLLKFLLKNFAKATNTEIAPSFLSRLGGSLLTLAWGWVFIVFALILLAALPTWGDAMTAMHTDLTKSASYFFAKPWGESLFGTPKQKVITNGTTTAAGNAQSDGVKALAEDPRFQEVLKDPEIQKEIEAHDIVKLMSNPKMMDLTRQIMSDPATLKKVMAVYSSQTASKSVFASTDPSNRLEP